jgi:predicted transcriptional regulator
MKQKLDKTHIESIRELRQNFANNANAVGNVTIEREFLKEQLEQIERESKKYLQEFKELKQQEEALFAELKERYGDGQINIEDGTFDPL